MVATLLLEPLADDTSTHTFDPVSVNLPTENRCVARATYPETAPMLRLSLLVLDAFNFLRLYTIGFQRNPTQSQDGKIADVGFSDRVEDDKFCIVPVESEDTSKIKDPFGVIWLAPGYKVRTTGHTFHG